MSIFALPPSTAHLLRSSSTIADPLSLVKELVDNSIDAGATSIEITIASNTVDRIQVRDNGSGIQPEDYGSLGRRSHTSKLRDFDELHLKGGKTLGFRGEALASANCLATIKITTRTAQDPVASLLQLKRGSGGISTQKPISGTVGTTVQAVNLFENIPVRRQNAIKVSRKTLADIRRLLESYVIALPHVKLSLKVPGSPSQTWLYSPCSLSTTRDAITQVFGHALTAQLVVSSSDSSQEGPAEAYLQNVRMTTILPRPGGDAKAIKGRGAFISVDSRPLSHLRGTGKKLFSIFKSSLSKASTSSDSLRAPSSPFMQLSIQCSPGSYDPNISPLKDEVLFLNEPDILSCFQNLCDAVYNKKALASRKSQNQLVSVERSQSPGMGGSSVTEPTPIDGAYLNEAESECLTTDQELLDSLSDGLERLLGGNSGAFGSGERRSASAFTLLTPPKNNARPEHWDQMKRVQETQTIETLMRTRLKVNLSRKESDSTDLGDTEGLVSVQIAPRKAVSPAKTPSRSHSRGRTLTSSRRFEDIGDFFLPVRDEPVEIATDETATPENTEPDNDFPSHDGTHRLPLKELTESDLNTFREEEDEETDQESMIELSFVEPNIAPSPRTSPRRMTGSLAPNNPFRPLTRPRQVPNPDLQLANLRNPPSSDPTRLANLTTRDSRRHSTTNSSTRGQRPSRGNAMLSVNRLGDHGLRQSRLLLGSGPTVSQNRRRSEQARHGNGLASRRSTLTPSREEASAHLKDMLHSSHADSEDQEG
jgi:DNA mismatch repair protein MutL